MNRQAVTLVGVSVVSAAVGVGVGYFFAKRKFDAISANFDELMDKELDKAHEHYRTIYKTGPGYESPQARADDLKIFDDAAAATLLRQYQGDEPEAATPLQEEESVESRNVFEEAEELSRRSRFDGDWDEELRKREENPDVPYIIAAEEYFNEELKYDQVNLKYYRGDAVLCTENDDMIEEGNVDSYVGIDNLSRFGHFSNDPMIVYVRNPNIGMEFEIILSEGAYNVEVLGNEPPPLRVIGPNNPKNMPARQRYERGTRVGGIAYNNYSTQGPQEE